MARLGELDVPDRLAPYMPAWASQILFGIFCAGAAAVFRLVVDLVSPGAGPFALVYPLVLVSTLFGRWLSGAVTLSTAIVGAWYFVLAPRFSWMIADPGNVPRTVVNILAAAGVVIVAEMFRRSVRAAARESDAKVEKQSLFFKEFDHRIKNNFMVVASLLDMQRRRAGDETTKAALKEATERVQGIAAAHQHLYREDGDPRRVEMKSYLEALCQSLADALFLRGAVQLVCRADPALMPRDRAVSLGLILNELVTNAAKHAFVGRAGGRIDIDFAAVGDHCVLTVADDGRGMPENASKRGLGGGLVEAFALQAGAVLRRESSDKGTRVMLEIEP